MLPPGTNIVTLLIVNTRRSFLFRDAANNAILVSIRFLRNDGNDSVFDSGDVIG